MPEATFGTKWALRAAERDGPQRPQTAAGAASEEQELAKRAFQGLPTTAAKLSLPVFLIMPNSVQEACGRRRALRKKREDTQWHGIGSWQAGQIDKFAGAAGMSWPHNAHALQLLMAVDKVCLHGSKFTYQLFLLAP